jgi:hypothetical protein
MYICIVDIKFASLPCFYPRKTLDEFLIKTKQTDNESVSINCYDEVLMFKHSICTNGV